jgi:hypothetical protein
MATAMVVDPTVVDPMKAFWLADCQAFERAAIYPPRLLIGS